MHNLYRVDLIELNPRISFFFKLEDVCLWGSHSGYLSIWNVSTSIKSSCKHTHQNSWRFAYEYMLRGEKLSNQKLRITPRDQLSTNHKLSITSRDQLSTNHKPSITSRDQLSTNHKLTITPRDQLSTSHKYNLSCALIQILHVQICTICVCVRTLKY